MKSSFLSSALVLVASSSAFAAPAARLPIFDLKAPTEIVALSLDTSKTDAGLVTYELNATVHYYGGCLANDAYIVSGQYDGQGGVAYELSTAAYPEKPGVMHCQSITQITDQVRVATFVTRPTHVTVNGVELK